MSGFGRAAGSAAHAAGPAGSQAQESANGFAPAVANIAVVWTAGGASGSARNSAVIISIELAPPAGANPSFAATLSAKGEPPPDGAVYSARTIAGPSAAPHPSTGELAPAGMTSPVPPSDSDAVRSGPAASGGAAAVSANGLMRVMAGGADPGVRGSPAPPS